MLNNIVLEGKVTDIDGSHFVIETVVDDNYKPEVACFLLKFYPISVGDNIRVTGFMRRNHFESNMFYITKVECI